MKSGKEAAPLYEIVVPVKIGSYRDKIYCYIWEKKYQLLKATSVNGAHAHTTLKTSKGKDRIEIHFWAKRLGLDYTTHEFAHACIIFANILELKIQTPFYQKRYEDEELFVRCLGRSIRLFYEKLHKYKAIDMPDFVESIPLDK